MFVAFLIASVFARDFEFDLNDPDNEGTQILKDVGKLELLFQRNGEKFTKEYIERTKEEYGLFFDLTNDDIENVHRVAQNMHERNPSPFSASEENQKKTEALFEDFQSPQYDFNYRMVNTDGKTERLCQMQANNWPKTFSNCFSERGWAAIKKFDKKDREQFRRAVGLSEAEWDNAQAGPGDTDHFVRNLRTYALEGCKIPKFRWHFSVMQGNWPGNSSVSLGLFATFALAALAF